MEKPIEMVYWTNQARATESYWFAGVRRRGTYQDFKRVVWGLIKRDVWIKVIVR